MSAKTRELFRSLRVKSNKERQKSAALEKIPEKSSSLDKRKNNIMMFQSPRKPANKNNNEGIDPLDYFKSEHIFIQPSNMEEFMVKDKKKEEEEKKKKEEKTTAGILGGPTTHKIKFEDMKKMWKKVRKIDADKEIPEKEEEDNKSEHKHANSVETRNIKHDESAENINDSKKNNVAKSVDKKRYGVQKMGKKTQDEQNMYIKLVLARNRFNQNSLEGQSVYDNIMNLMKQMKSIDNFPDDLSNEVDKLITKLELPENIIIDSDVQQYYPEDKFEPLISNPLPLDDVLKKYNFTKE